MHARLKCCDDRFASNSQHVLHAIDWIERNPVASSIHFAEKKNQSDISVDRVIYDDQFTPPLRTSDELLSTFTICLWIFLLNLGSLGYTLSF